MTKYDEDEELKKLTNILNIIDGNCHKEWIEVSRKFPSNLLMIDFQVLGNIESYFITENFLKTQPYDELTTICE